MARLVGNDQNALRGNISRQRGNFNIEVIHEGDDGKQKMIFVDVLILCFRTKNKNPKIIELQIREVESSKDTRKLLRFIVETVTPEILKLVQARLVSQC